MREFPESNSQALQDVFVLCASRKWGGSFVEVGGFHSRNLSNTFLLETEFGWSGTIFELRSDLAAEIRHNRSATVVEGDARKVKWRTLVRRNVVSRKPDYFQVDCEPSLTSLQILISALLSGLRPSVITFEHDAYSSATILGVIRQGRFTRIVSRVLLRTLGYRLVGPNILTESGKPFEDWWISKEIRSTFPKIMKRHSWRPIELLESLGMPTRTKELRTFLD